ncbi:MAG: polysaccharide biosynthesis C-terminal domain-containing protein [Bacteroidetes bacterium]|nr:polysaccharide biosynthesis C-terminal domain-containing protein [Bacteroidota bacterium]
MLKSLKSSFTNTLIYGVGNLATKLVGFILIPIYVKYFSTATYGVLGLLEVTGIALTSILGLSLSQALYRWYWDEEYAKQKKSMFFTLILFLSAFLAFTIFTSHYFTSIISNVIFGDISYRKLVFLVIVASSLQIIMQLVSSLIQLQQKAVLFTISNISILIIQLFFTVFFIVHMNLGLNGIYYAQIISLLTYFIIVSKFILNNIELKIEFNLLKLMFIYSSPMLISNIAALVISISDRYFIRVFGSLGNLGVYQFGYKIVNTLSVLVIASAQMAIFPMMFKKMNDPDAKRFYSKMKTYFTFGIMFFVLFLNFYGMEIIKVLAKKQEYWDSFKIIPFISLGIIFAMLRDLNTIPLQIVKKSALISKIVIVAAVFSFSINWLIIPKYGSMGAATSFIISQLFYFLLMYYYAQKHYRINYEVYKIIKMIVIAIGLFLLSLLLAKTHLFIRLSVKFLMILSFPVLLYYWNFFEEIEIDRMKGSWEKWKNLKKFKSNFFELLKGGTQ